MNDIKTKALENKKEPKKYVNRFSNQPAPAKDSKKENIKGYSRKIIIK